MLDALRARSVKFHSITEAIDTATSRADVADDRCPGGVGT
jgi:hypothetical protein